tara:strand:- start:1951 stop:2340 length:390 start_codon:yes stop_codon:yes gene_type:complete
MATLTPTLTLASTDAFSNQPISLSVTDSLTIAAPYTDVSKIAAATGGSIITAASGAPITYFYLKHTGLLASDGTTATTNLVTVSDAGGAAIATLATGEFMFFPSAAGEGVKVTSATAAVFVEYAYFSKA